MAELFDVRVVGSDKPLDRAALLAALQDADILVPTLTDTIDAPLLAGAGERLKLIANYGAGVDHIDVATARQRGILVSNTPGVLTASRWAFWEWAASVRRWPAAPAPSA